MFAECPGAKNFKRPKPENIKCSFCSTDLEIWTDELSAVCPGCKNTVKRKPDQSCIDWCKFAKECVGDELFDKYLKNKKQSINNN